MSFRPKFLDPIIRVQLIRVTDWEIYQEKSGFFFCSVLINPLFGEKFLLILMGNIFSYGVPPGPRLPQLPYSASASTLYYCTTVLLVRVPGPGSTTNTNTNTTGIPNQPHKHNNEENAPYSCSSNSCWNTWKHCYVQTTSTTYIYRTSTSKESSTI